MATKKATARKAPRPAKKVTRTKKKTPVTAVVQPKSFQKHAAKKAVSKKPVVKQAVKKPAVKRVAKKAAVRKTATPRALTRNAVAPSLPVSPPAISANRPSWVDELTQTPLIDDYARQLESFITAMADGRVEADEVAKQEQRVVMLLRELDPQFDDTIHAKVTELLCELTAYAIMQMLYAMEQARPKTVFQG